MFLEISVLAIMIFKIIPWIEVEVKKDKSKLEMEKID